MSDDDPTPRQIAKEIAIYAAVILAAGAAFVAVRYWREGPRIFHHDPRAYPAEPR
jgi:hypothetical protein